MLKIDMRNVQSVFHSCYPGQAGATANNVLCGISYGMSEVQQGDPHGPPPLFPCAECSHYRLQQLPKVLLLHAW